jgi:hypothetical protein
MYKKSLFLLVLIFTVAVNAQWIQTNGPYGGGIRALMVSDSNLFASNGYGVFRSTDSGNDWIQVEPNLSIFRSISCFTRIGMNLFAGSDDGFTGTGVFLSTNDGANWTVANTGLTNNYVESLAVLGANLFAGTEGGGVFLSTNNGTNWTAVDSGLTNSFVYSLGVSGTSIFAGTEGGVFCSCNNGASWTPADSGLPKFQGIPFEISFCFSDTNLFCTVGGCGVFRSTDNGKSWISVCTTGPISHAGAIFMNDTILFAGTCGAGIFRSTDYGVTWTLTDSSLTHPYIDCFCVSGSYLFAGDIHNGVYRTNNNGDNWTQVNQGIFLIINCVVVRGTDLYAGTAGGGVFLTTDNGISWNPLSNYCASQEGFNSGISALVVTDTTIFISNNNYVDLSTNNGESWTELDSVRSNTPIYALTILDTNLFAGAGGSGAFRSSNNGSSWIPIDSGLTNDTVWALTSSSINVFAGTQNGLFLSTNEGVSWTQVNKGQSFSRVFALTVSGENLYACTDAGAYVSTDNGSSWTAEPGLSKNDIIGLAASKNFLFAATSAGVWKHQLLDTDVEGTNKLPKHFSLQQNFPNPFNPSTVINYSVPNLSMVTIKVYDVLGREITTLVNEEKSAGNYIVQFNAGNLSSGIYFYRMKSGSFSQTKKFLLLK